jgi:hypothetical protein
VEKDDKEKKDAKEDKPANTGEDGNVDTPAGRPDQKQSARGKMRSRRGGRAGAVSGGAVAESVSVVHDAQGT